MSAIVWIAGLTLLGVVTLLAGRRLRRAARTVDRILAEETEPTKAGEPAEDVPPDGTRRGTPHG